MIKKNKEYSDVQILHTGLMAFCANSCCPRTDKEIKGKWIISKDEVKALEVVLDMLSDCGGDIMDDELFVANI